MRIDETADVSIRLEMNGLDIAEWNALEPHFIWLHAELLVEPQTGVEWLHVFFLSAFFASSATKATRLVAKVEHDNGGEKAVEAVFYHFLCSRQDLVYFPTEKGSRISVQIKPTLPHQPPGTSLACKAGTLFFLVVSNVPVDLLTMYRVILLRHGVPE